MTIIFKTKWFWKILVIKPWRQSLCTLVGRQAVLESFIIVETLAVWTQEVELSCVRSTRTYTVSELSDHCGDTEGFERPVTTRKNPHTWLRDRAGVDLTVVAPSHSDGAATLLLGDVGGQNTVAENRVVEVQVTLLLLLCQDSNRCNGWIKKKKRTDVVLSEFVLKRLDKFFNLRKSVLAYPHSCVCLLTGHNHGCRHTQKNPACSHKCQRAGTVSCSQHIRQCLAEKTNSLDSKTNFFREIKFW